MADVAAATLRSAAAALQNYTPELAQAVREGESKTDHYEDILGTYLVKLSALKISENDSSEAAMLLKALSDFERIGDHALNHGGVRRGAEKQESGAVRRRPP